jgi:uncharacterized protein (DUF433 family)
MDRITTDICVRWGTPCLRDTGITVAYVIALQAEGLATGDILEHCPGLLTADVDAALAWYREFGEWGLLPSPPDPLPDHPRICVDPHIQGGYPVIAGTRVPVDAIAGLWEDGFGLEEILEEYPDLTVADVDDALGYDLDARGAVMSPDAYAERARRARRGA